MESKIDIKVLKSMNISEFIDSVAKMEQDGLIIPKNIIKRIEEHKRVLSMVELDKSYNCELLAGVDEAGRGPLAGDVFAAAVILKPGTFIEGINDSKKLSEKKREELYDIITEEALCWSVARVDNEEIDRINILNATFKAMNNAIEMLNVKPNHVLIDGNMAKGMKYPYNCIIKGDSLSIAISAASIIAKVSRDRYIKELDEEYPHYGFAKNKGYGTKEHMDAIRAYGPCKIHRRSFIGRIV